MQTCVMVLLGNIVLLYNLCYCPYNRYYTSNPTWWDKRSRLSFRNQGRVWMRHWTRQIPRIWGTERFLLWHCFLFNQKNHGIASCACSWAPPTGLLTNGAWCMLCYRVYYYCINNAKGPSPEGSYYTCTCTSACTYKLYSVHYIQDLVVALCTEELGIVKYNVLVVPNKQWNLHYRSSKEDTVLGQSLTSTRLKALCHALRLDRMLF